MEFKFKLKNYNKYNITPNDCKFIINKNNKTVICIYEDSAYDFINFAYRNFKIKPHYISIPERLTDKLLMPNKFIGIATCGPDDEWNESIGRAIAFSRVKDKVLKSFFKRAQNYITILDTWLTDSVEIINEFGEKVAKNTEHRHNYINSLFDGK